MFEGVLPRVIKQVIWIESLPYLLQEVYGFPDQLKEGDSLEDIEKQNLRKDPTIAEECEENAQPECIVCLSEEKNTIVLPCRHLCLCKECAIQIRRQTRKCPICRQDYHSLLHIDSKESN